MSAQVSVHVPGVVCMCIFVFMLGETEGVWVSRIEGALTAHPYEYAY
jgi:hypothetical protein